MAINVNYGPSASAGAMMYGASQNEEQNRRLQELLQWMVSIRGMNQQGSLERERMGLQERMGEQQIEQTEKDRVLRERDLKMREDEYKRQMDELQKAQNMRGFQTMPSGGYVQPGSYTSLQMMLQNRPRKTHPTSNYTYD